MSAEQVAQGRQLPGCTTLFVSHPADGHMSALLATVRVIQARRATMRGVVKAIFQPAEEGHAGAKAMIEDGVLTERVGGPGAAVDAIFGIHLWSMLPVGVVSVREGACMVSFPSGCEQETRLFCCVWRGIRLVLPLF